MATYMQLCNKVIQESANELTELTLVSWNEPVAGRRQYPRIKRMVAEAWKALQMERDEWEFKSQEMNTTLYPRIKIVSGLRASGDPPIGTVFRGAESGFEFTVRAIHTVSGSWAAGTFNGQLDVDADAIGNTLTVNELFEEVSPVVGDGQFIYEQKGSYDPAEFDPLMREIRWESMVVSQDGLTPTQCIFIPWNNWMYKELSFTQGSRSVPIYYSQDFEGNLVFYPQTLDSFNVSFIYDTAPQIFSDPEDEPVLLKDEYHDWIAWKALENIAQYDKNPTLFNYANKWATFYKGRADKELMPIPRWGANRFEE